MSTGQHRAVGLPVFFSRIQDTAMIWAFAVTWDAKPNSRIYATQPALEDFIGQS